MHMKKIEIGKLKSALMITMLSGYGVALTCVGILLSNPSDPKYFESDSRGASLPVKRAVQNTDPTLIIVFLLAGSAVGVSAQLTDKYRKKHNQRIHSIAACARSE
jgi:hypothetical protein